MARKPSKRAWVGFAAVAITAATFTVDLLTPRSVAAGVLPYFLAIFLTSWLRWPAAPFAFAAAASALTLLGYLLTNGGHPDIIPVNRLSVIGALWLVAIMAHLRLKQNAMLVENQAGLEADRRFRMLFEESNLGMHITTPTRRVFVNRALVDMLGYDSIDDLLNAPKFAIVAPHDLAKAMTWEQVERSFEELPKVYEFDGMRKDGSIVRLQGMWRWIDWEGERAISRILIDITDRKRAEEALAANEGRMRLLIDSLEEGVFGTDAEGRCTFCNPAALRLLGHGNASSVIGQDMHQLVHHTRADGRALDKSECAITMHRNSGLPYRSDDDVFWRADGTSFPVSYRILPLESDAEPRGSVAIFSDLTAAKKNRAILRERDRTVRELQSELRRATQISAMGQVSAIMAHELHQPLTAVLNTAYAIRRWMRQGAENRTELLDEMVPLLCEQAEKAGQVVRRIRNLFEKGETGKALSDLNAVIEETCTLIAVEFQSANIRISRRFDYDLPRVPIDRVQIQQVVYNLLRNAVEAISDLPVRDIVVTTAQAPDEQIEISVRDSGQGLPRQATEDIFMPFVTTKIRGMGLGLYTCKTILEAHGGRIWAEANREGGATFHFTIPAA